MRIPGRSGAGCLSILLILSRAAAAQGLSAGIVGGFNTSTFSDFPNAGPETPRHESGVLAGFYLELPLGRAVSLETEVSYTQKGTRVEGPATLGGPSTVFLAERFDYVEIPILVRVGATGNRAGVYGVAGPAVARLVRARERFEVPGFPALDQDISDGVTSTDASVVVGAGLSIGRLAIEGRLDVGLRNLMRPADRRPGDPELTNRCAGVIVRLRL
jgi:hypothetical protein